MSEQVVIPQSEIPAAPAPVVPDASAEIAYLKAHGMEGEAGSLAAELEGLLQARDQAPAVTPTQAPITQTPAPVPVTPSQAPTSPQTAQEKALDPYAVDGGDEAPVVIDEQGRARDAATGKYVPLKALHREREFTKQAREEAQTLREQNARVEERLSILNEILSAQDDTPPTPTPAPVDERPVLADPVDPEKDIFAWAKQQQEFAQKQTDYIKKLEDKLSGTEQLTRSQIESMQADQAIRSDVSQFYAKNPDFLDAYNHLRTVRDRALTTLGFADKAARDAQLAREEQALAQNSLKNRSSYAERVYKLAEDYGYKRPGVQQPNPTPPAIQEPVTPQPVAATAPTVDPQAAAKIAAIQKGKDVASPTLNGAGGSAAEGLTVSQLANMSEAEFLNLAGKLGKSKLDSLLRGT